MGGGNGGGVRGGGWEREGASGHGAQAPRWDEVHDERSMERDLVRVLQGNSTTRTVDLLQGDRKRHRRELRRRHRRARPIPPEINGVRRHIGHGQAKGPRDGLRSPLARGSTLGALRN